MAVNKKLNILIQQIEKNKLSHAFLLETNDIDACYIDILELVKRINCPQKYKDKCNACQICNLIDKQNLPSLITIEPDGLNIKKESMQYLEQKFSTKPVYSNYNIYIIKNAEKMNDYAANTILKFLEEPEDNIIGILLTTNKELILSTIKSRCEIVSLNYKKNTDLNVDRELVKTYLSKIISNNDYLLNKNLLLKNYNTREDLIEFVKIMEDYLEEQLKLNINNNDITEINLKKIEINQKVLSMLQYNVNLELAFDYFFLEMRRLNG